MLKPEDSLHNPLASSKVHNFSDMEKVKEYNNTKVRITWYGWKPDEIKRWWDRAKGKQKQMKRDMDEKVKILSSRLAKVHLVFHGLEKLNELLYPYSGSLCLPCLQKRKMCRWCSIRNLNSIVDNDKWIPEADKNSKNERL